MTLPPAETKTLKISQPLSSRKVFIEKTLVDLDLLFEGCDLLIKKINSMEFNKIHMNVIVSPLFRVKLRSEFIGYRPLVKIVSEFQILLRDLEDQLKKGTRTFAALGQVLVFFTHIANQIKIILNSLLKDFDYSNELSLFSENYKEKKKVFLMTSNKEDIVFIKKTCELHSLLEFLGVTEEEKELEKFLESNFPDLLLIEEKYSHLLVKFPIIPYIIIGTQFQEQLSVLYDGLYRGALDCFFREDFLSDDRCFESFSKRIYDLSHFGLGALLRFYLLSSVPSLEGFLDLSKILVIGLHSLNIRTLFDLLENLPSVFPPVLIIQKRHQWVSEQIVSVLRSQGNFKIGIPVSGESILPGKIYILPWGKHFKLLSKGAEKQFQFDSMQDSQTIDAVFEEVFEKYQQKTVGLLLGGSDTEGVSGLLKIKLNGGYSFVQHPDDCFFSNQSLQAVERKACHEALRGEQVPYKVLNSLSLLRHSHILLIDAEKAVRASIQSFLKTLGVQKFSEAESATKAFSLMGEAYRKRSFFSLIISDLYLPDMSGLVFLKKVRSDARFQNVPFIFATSFSDREVVLKALEVGTTAFIVKPVTLKVLRDKLQELLSSYVSPISVS